MSNITLQKSKIKEEKGMVVLPVEEYRKLLMRAVPTYYLTGKAAVRLDKLVEKGLKDYRAGRTVAASSLKEALGKYAKKRRG